MSNESTKNVLITGTSRGIGHALAAAYLDRGWRVLGLSRRTPDDLCQHERFRFESLDLHDAYRSAVVLRRLLDEVPQLDVAILNAGILGSFGDMHDAALDELRNVMEVNLWANKTVIDAILEADIPVGQIVTISSGAAVSGNRGWRGYAISKAALNMLTRLYAQDRPDIHFCAFAPGTIDTAMQEAIATLPPEQYEKYETLRVLRSKRSTPEMPPPEEAADRLIETIARLPELVPSGDFADIRRLPGA